MTNLPSRQNVAEINAPVPTKPFSDPSLARLKNAMGWVEGKPTLMGGFEISPDYRRRLQAWQTTLKSRASCGANDDRLKAVELAKLVAYPMQGEAQVSSDLRVETYFEALEGLPAWAVKEARQMIVRGETQFGKPWGPGPTEFASLVRTAVLDPILRDLSDIGSLLLAEPIGATPKVGEKERITEGFEQIKGEMRPQRTAHQVYEDAMAGLAKRARDNGVDFKTAFDALPNAKPSSGTLGKVEI